MNPVLHPDRRLLARYAEGRLDEASAVSVELHAQHCVACRAALGDALPTPRLAANWAAVAAELDGPRRGPVERALGRRGLDWIIRLMAATPSLRRAWYVATLVAVLFGLVAAGQNRAGGGSLALFLTVAPLVPTAGVALAYGPGVDPCYEVTVAAPVSGIRLVLIRTATVLGCGVVFSGLAALLLAHRHGWIVAAWLLPALGLSCACLALMTFLSPRVAGGIVCGVWAALVLVVTSGPDADLAAFAAASQVVAVVLALVGATVVALRRRRFDVVLR